MIPRYSRPEMEKIWTLQFRFEQLLKIEVAAAQAQAKLGIIPKEAALAIEKKASFSVERILKLEAETKHDVIAFVSNVAENIGPHGRYVHFGLTSSDVLDSAMSLVVRSADAVLKVGLNRLESELVALIKQYEDTICAGRTHGMHAEPTTFGFKMASFLAELRRCRVRIDTAIQSMAIVKLSGPVGTYSNGMKEVEALVGKQLGLTPETVATQVVPRDRHADVLVALGFFGGFVERLAVELRHLQRTEVSEVIEAFKKAKRAQVQCRTKRIPLVQKT